MGGGGKAGHADLLAWSRPESRFPGHTAARHDRAVPSLGYHRCLLRRLLDASLLQITYDLIGSEVVAHRLAYTPCPFIVDTEFLEEGNPIDEVVGMYVELSDVALRSPIRFDYDLRAAKGNHPAAHLTLNSADCRIACVAPMHALRFVDFIFRHFYPALWNAHSPFFDAAAWRHMGAPVITSEDRTSPHLIWDVRATETEVAAIRRGA